MQYVKPRLSEKAFALSQATNTFVLDVPSDLNKHQVAETVEKQFEVKVAKVRLINRKGKSKRVMNLTGKRSMNRQGVQADIKKAYVTLAAGSHLPFFTAAEEEIAEAEAKKKDAKKADKKDKKAEKADKKAEKSAKKGDK